MNANTEEEMRYNTSLCRTRVLIEQTFGILKRRFQALQGLRCSPEQAISYIVACVVLHNIGILQGDILDIDFDNDNIPPQPIQRQVEDRPDGAAMRQHIVTSFFS